MPHLGGDKGQAGIRVELLLGRMEGRAAPLRDGADVLLRTGRGEEHRAVLVIGRHMNVDFDLVDPQQNPPRCTVQDVVDVRHRTEGSDRGRRHRGTSDQHEVRHKWFEATHVPRRNDSFKKGTVARDQALDRREDVDSAAERHRPRLAGEGLGRVPKPSSRRQQESIHASILERTAQIPECDDLKIERQCGGLDLINALGFEQPPEKDRKVRAARAHGSVTPSRHDFSQPPHCSRGQIGQWLGRGVRLLGRDVRQVGRDVAKAFFEARCFGGTEALQNRDGRAKIGRVGGASDLGEAGKRSELVSERGSCHLLRLADLTRTKRTVLCQTRACPWSFTTHPCERRPHEMQRRNMVPSLQLTL